MDTSTVQETFNHAVDASAAIHMMWLLVIGVLALVVQAAFALLGTGLVRAKNVAHTMAMGLLAYCTAMLGFWTVGFALSGGGNVMGSSALASPSLHELTLTLAGHSFGLFGSQGFFLSPTLTTSAMAASFVLYAAFASIVATIPGGAMAERWKLTSLVSVCFGVSAVIYPVYANWVWGGGWLSSLGTSFGLGHGVVDCAGSSVVHMTGGVIALVAAKTLGPRLGKYTLRGDVRPIPAHNMAMVVLGTLLFAAGWFGLACGSALMGLMDIDRRVALMGMNVMLASSAGGLAAFVHTRMRFGKPDLSMTCNGLLAALVAISAPGALVGSVSAVVIGAVASFLAIEGALFIERKLRIDDPVGAAAVHGLGGAWGLLAVGLFANGRAGDGLNGVAGPVRGLLAGGGGQLAASIIGIVANILWVVPATVVTLWIAGRVTGNRATADDEIAGLDVPELGMTGYVSEAVHAGATRGGDTSHGRRSDSRSA